MPDQDRVAKTLANPEYWNKKHPIKTDFVGDFEENKARPLTNYEGLNGNAHYTLLHEIQEQLRGTKLNIYLHTEYQSKLQDAQS